MPIDPADAARALKFANERALLHTDCVLRAEVGGRAGFASCVLLEFEGQTVAVTCEHVLRPDATYFIGPNRLEVDRVPDDPGPKVRAARLLAQDKAADLAVFVIPDDEPARRGKRSYRVTLSDPITEERVANQLKTASFICGIFGKASTALQYPDGLVYTQLPLYSAIGPIEACSGTEIIADMAEKEVIYADDRAFPQLRDVKPTGGVRELGGISGSGLWLKVSDELLLAGIVLGRAKSRDDQHLIRVTPVWLLRAWLATVLAPRGS